MNDGYDPYNHDASAQQHYLHLMDCFQEFAATLRPSHAQMRQALEHAWKGCTKVFEPYGNHYG